MPELHIKSRNSEFCEILSGPSKWDLSIGLFDRKTVNTRKLDFQVKIDGDIRDIHITVKSVEAEDGSGECWNVKGYLFDLIQRHPTGNSSPKPPRDVSFFYRTDKRTGTLKFLN